MPNVLIVDDDATTLTLAQRALEKLDGFTVNVATNANDAVQILQSQQVDVALYDVLLPEGTGFDLLRRTKQLDETLPVVFMTAGGRSGPAIEAMKAGAFDFISKPLDVSQLQILVAHAADVRRLMLQPAGFAHTFSAATSSEGDLLVGRSAVMTEVYKSIGRVAPRNVTVLIRGESGTGKELVAHALYQHSSRANGPFLAVNCAAIPESLLESELFGHERGAFTGADRRRVGKFEQCHGGTLFLDEIGDMPLALQGKILRLLQDQRFERVGGNETVQTDVRIIAATHRDLEAMADEGDFRPDLYYRLNVYEIMVPPLRERLEDLPLLMEHFLQQANTELNKNVCRVSNDAMRMLRQYRWPGNVRELQSMLRKAVLNTSGPLLLDEFLPLKLRMQPKSPEPPAACDSSAEIPMTSTGPGSEWEQFVENRLMEGSHLLYDEMLERMERWLIAAVLRHTSGNQAQAANILGVTRTTLRSKLGRLGLSIERVVDEGGQAM